MADQDKPIVVDGVKVNFTQADLEDEHYWDIVQDVESNPGKMIKGLRYLMGEEAYYKLRDPLKDKSRGKTSLVSVANWCEKACEKRGVDSKKL